MFALVMFALTGFGAHDEAGAAPNENNQPTVMPDSSTPIASQSNGLGATAALPQTPATPLAAANPLWAMPFDDLSATRERPLFSASRRPPAMPEAVAIPLPTAARATVIAPESPPFTLVGTIVSADEKIAFFRNSATNTVTRTREGEEQSGWLVRSVSQRSAIVEKDHRTVTIDLPKNNANAGSPAAPSSSLPPGVEQTL